MIWLYNYRIYDNSNHYSGHGHRSDTINGAANV